MTGSQFALGVRRLGSCRARRASRARPPRCRATWPTASAQASSTSTTRFSPSPHTDY